MKKFLLIALMGIALFSCKKDDDDNGGSSSSFSATIDGAKWTPVSTSGISTLGAITILAADTKSSISLVIVNTAKGDYVIGTVEGTSEVTYTSSTQTFAGTSGKVSVTAHDAGNKKISGSFDVVVTGITGATGTHTLKGTFSINYSSFLKK